MFTSRTLIISKVQIRVQDKQGSTVLLF